MALSTQNYKGARDFYPADKRIQDYIFNTWRTVAERYGYEEYDASIIEPLELYLAKTSEEIVNEQTYVFEDRGGRKVTLRPEMTPTVSRMVAAKRQELAYPLRWFSIPNLWRYERPQRGRLREHWQLNVDLFGEPGLPGDHELVMVADSVMQQFGATRDMYTILLNSRKLVNFVLNELFSLDNDTSIKVIRLVDRIQKMSEPDFITALGEIVGDKAQAINDVFRVTSFEALPQDIQAHDSAKHVHELQMLLARSGVTNVTFDISLMRGFDYYTDIVFEMKDVHPDNNRSMFGGGRYDGLVGLFGVEPVPTVGFGMGDVTIHEFLVLHDLIPKFVSPVDIAVLLIGDVYAGAQDLLGQLRAADIHVAVDATDRKMDKKIKSADKAGYSRVLFVGDQELANNQYALKDLASGEEKHLSMDEIIAQLR
jgi:histidyl-tRNA synthetase